MNAIIYTHAIFTVLIFVGKNVAITTLYNYVLKFETEIMSKLNNKKIDQNKHKNEFRLYGLF